MDIAPNGMHFGRARHYRGRWRPPASEPPAVALTEPLATPPAALLRPVTDVTTMWPIGAIGCTRWLGVVVASQGLKSCYQYACDRPRDECGHSQPEPGKQPANRLAQPAVADILPLEQDPQLPTPPVNYVI